MISWWNSQIYLQELVITPYKFISRYPQWNRTDREKTWRDFHLTAFFTFLPYLRYTIRILYQMLIGLFVKMLPSSKKYIITLIPSTRSVFDVWNRDIFCDVKPQGVFSVYSLTNILVLIFLAFLRELSHNKSTFFLALICTNYPRTLSCNSSAMRRNTVFCNKEIFEFFLNVIFIELRSLIFDIQTHR